MHAATRYSRRFHTCQVVMYTKVVTGFNYSKSMQIAEIVKSGDPTRIDDSLAASSV